MTAGDSFRLAEETARNSYSRLLAILASRTRDVVLAEDALAGAFQAALEHWPKSSVPANPEAWILTTARRRLIDGARHEAVREKVLPDLTLMSEEANRIHDVEEDLFPDERLKLLFVCAHPSIDQQMHTPLMLQTVLGLEANLIARAFLIAPATMGQRLVRAKRKIKDAGIPFSIPDKDQLTGRVSAVLEAVYVAYSTGWDEQFGADGKTAGFVEEAIWLGRLVASLLPDNAEAKGLLALMLYAHSRADARRAADGAYVPLQEQDAGLWDMDLIGTAENLLLAASALNAPGRYQLEAAIQSAHIQGILKGSMNWSAVIMLYSRLLETAPSIGARVAQAGAVAMSGRPEDAAKLLAELREPCEQYQPYWAALAYTERRLGNFSAATAAYQRAIKTCTDDTTARWLRKQAESIQP